MCYALTPEKFRSFGPIVVTWWKKWWTGAVAFVIVLFTLAHYVTVAFNVSDSLPYKVFIVLKQEKAVGRGQYAAFPWEGDRPYPRGLRFIKEVAGVPGDIVTVDSNREFRIEIAPSAAFRIPGMNEAAVGSLTRDVGRAKEFGSVGNMRGVPLPLGFTGTIPAGYFYMHAPNKDSLDSRYALLGLIAEEKIDGRAIPLF